MTLGAQFSDAQTHGYDIIGDIHGCALTLEKLLDRLGYEEIEGAYQHPQRCAIFVGDIIDRGPRIRESLQIVRAMVDGGFAQCIIGNHEFNAVAYTTVLHKGDAKQGQSPVYLRPHDQRNNRLIRDTLIQFASYPEEWRDYLEWFKTLPIFLDMDNFRVVHACWDTFSAQVLSAYSTGDITTLNDIFPALLSENTSEKTHVLRCLDRLTRGTSLRYPDGRYIISQDGLKRHIFRTKFWSENPRTYQDVVFQPDPLPDDLPERSLSKEEKACLIQYDKKQKPVFFGHYWLHGRPKMQGRNLACLDYSAVKFGRLVAYRFDGEAQLNNDKFVWVYVDPEVSEESV